MARRTYVYRLHVQLPPEAADPYWRPPAYTAAYTYGDDPDKPFRWPPRRMYLSASAAQARAALLRRWGCTVALERSHMVTWPTGQLRLPG